MSEPVQRELFPGLPSYCLPRKWRVVLLFKTPYLSDFERRVPCDFRDVLTVETNSPIEAAEIACDRFHEVVMERLEPRHNKILRVDVDGQYRFTIDQADRLVPE